MAMLKGITIQLNEKVKVGVDPFNRDVYQDNWIEVDNVLVAPSSVDDITTAIDLVGKKAIYTLGIPKGDTHKWEDTEVKFFGSTWKTFGFVQEGIEAMVPTAWHKKIMVERYE